MTIFNALLLNGNPWISNKMCLNVPLCVSFVICQPYIGLVPNRQQVIIIPPEQRSCWGVYWFHSIRPSVRLSVRLSRLPCPLCNIYSSGWIISILATNDHYHERVCHTQWSLTLNYVFKVIGPWLRKSCPLCSVYSSGLILFIFGTTDHYYQWVCRVLRFFQNLII